MNQKDYSNELRINLKKVKNRSELKKVTYKG